MSRAAHPPAQVMPADRRAHMLRAWRMGARRPRRRAHAGAQPMPRASPNAKRLTNTACVTRASPQRTPADAVGGRDTLLDGGRRLGTWQKRAPLDTAQPSDAWVKVDAPDAPPPGPQGPQADQRRRRRALLLAAALGALLIAGAAAAAAVLGARASRAATAARKGEEGGPGAAPTDATWSIKLYPSGANGLPRAKATLEAAAPRIASGGGGKGAGSSSGAGGADGASTFIVDVSQPAASTLDAWRAQVRSAPLALGPDSAYSFLFEGRSDAPNATARAVLHSQASGKPVMVREVALGRNWAPLSLRLVQPDAADGRGALYSFQVRAVWARPRGACDRGRAY